MKNRSYFLYAAAAVAVIMLIIGHAQPKAADEKYCGQDKDCACGLHAESGQCFYGNAKYVNTDEECPDFCTGLAGDLTIKCVKNECRQVSEQ